MIRPVGLGKFALVGLNHMRPELPRCSVWFPPLNIQIRSGRWVGDPGNLPALPIDMGDKTLLD